MMELVNQLIVHVSYGEGTVISQEGNKVSVRFAGQEAVKQFVYPDAFERFLKVRDAKLENGIAQDLLSRKAQLQNEADQRQKDLAAVAMQNALEKMRLASEKKRPSKKKTPASE